EVVEALAERADGNPLFAEEMVQRLAEEGGGRAAELPDTVQGLLAARLDSLAPLERHLVAHAAVVGRTFWEGALAPVAAAEGGELRPRRHTRRGGASRLGRAGAAAQQGAAVPRGRRRRRERAVLKPGGPRPLRAGRCAWRRRSRAAGPHPREAGRPRAAIGAG